MSNRHPESDLELEFDIDEPPQKLLTALTEPTLVARWLAPVLDDTSSARPAGKSCQLIEADPGGPVSYLWHDADIGRTVVTFSVTATEDGLSRLTITHRALTAARAVAANHNNPLMALAA